VISGDEHCTAISAAWAAPSLGTGPYSLAVAGILHCRHAGHNIPIFTTHKTLALGLIADLP
jgi:hypothetical protein